MLKLTLPGFDYQVKKQQDTWMIFDVIRKKYVVLTPEEWVRQHVVHYLLAEKACPPALIAVEREIDLYGLRRRFDIVVFDRQAAPWLLVECKAPSVTLSQKVFDQVFRYNLTLGASYVAVTNGVQHYCARPDEKEKICLLNDFPRFDENIKLH